jgi:hypothetical protein
MGTASNKDGVYESAPADAEYRLGASFRELAEMNIAARSALGQEGTRRGKLFPTMEEWL